MKSKIIFSASLLAIILILSSFLSYQSVFGNQYETIKIKEAHQNITNNRQEEVSSCAKCHDCSGQSNWTDSEKIETIPTTEDANPKTDEEEKSTTSKKSEKIEVDDTLYPETFKNIQTN